MLYALICVVACALCAVIAYYYGFDVGYQEAVDDCMPKKRVKEEQ